MRPVTQINQIYGYLRVSTPEQVRSGVSLRQQETAIRKFVKEKYNRNVDEFFVDDGVSGTVPILDRAGSREMTDMIDRNDVVVCTRLDRLSRDASNLLGLIPQLEEVGITLFFCEQFGDVPIVVPKPLENRGLKARFDMNDMANKIMLMVLSAVAEIEHANIKDRFAEGKCDWGARGYSIGGKTPYGFRVVEEEHGSKRRKFLQPIPEEQKVLETIYALHRRGRRAKRIAKELKGLHNVDFSFQKIDRILKRKIQGLPKVA